MLERTRPQSPFYTGEHEAFRDVMHRFVDPRDRALCQRMG